MQLFTATVSASNENVVDLPGFSHWGQPRKEYGTTGRDVRTVYFFAKNRTQAARHLGRFAGISGPCELSNGDGRKAVQPLCTERMRERVQNS